MDVSGSQFVGAVPVTGKAQGIVYPFGAVAVQSVGLSGAGGGYNLAVEFFEEAVFKGLIVFKCINPRGIISPEF